jgi:cell wall-associated NlpC family hydrolase
LKEDELLSRLTIVSSLLAVGVALAQPAVAHAGSTQKSIVYAVQPGDSLWSISNRVHVSIATIEALNHLTDASILQLGQSLVLGQRTVAAAQPQRARRSTIALHRTTAARRVAARQSTRRALSWGSAHTLASQAVWAATHVGPTAPPELTPIGFAQQALALDAHITATALRYLGVPYVWGGTSFGGVDCSGFVWAVFAKNGINLARTADAQYEEGRHVATSDLRAGDLVFFQTYALGASHVGIYLGNGKFVHASSSNGVRVDQLGEDYYSERYLGARRLAKV